MTWTFCVTREDPELLNDIHDFTTQFYVILNVNACGTQVLRIIRVVYRECFRHAICNMEPFTILLPSNTASNVSTGHQKEYLTFLFSWFGKTNFLCPWTVILYFLGSWNVPETFPVQPSLNLPKGTQMLLACRRTTVKIAFNSLITTHTPIPLKLTLSKLVFSFLLGPVVQR